MLHTYLQDALTSGVGSDHMKGASEFIAVMIHSLSEFVEASILDYLGRSGAWLILLYNI